MQLHDKITSKSRPYSMRWRRRRTHSGTLRLKQQQQRKKCFRRKERGGGVEGGGGGRGPWC